MKTRFISDKNESGKQRKTYSHDLKLFQQSNIPGIS